MEDAGRSSFQYAVGERRLDVVSGRGHYYSHNADQMHTASREPAANRTKEVAPPSSTKPWGFGDPETKRRKRIAKYKVYTVEGRVKASIRNGFRWIKNKCSEIIHGY